MSVLIGHASINEVGKAHGGKDGDNNGKEVCTRNWYNKPWDVVLRPKTETLAEKSAKICESICNNPNVGYNQDRRNTLWHQYLKHGNIYSIEPCATDCSAFMTFCAILGGARIEHGTNAPTTRTMRVKFKASGDYEVITDKKYTQSEKLLKRGDILVKEGSHTVMVLTNDATANNTNPTTSTNCYPKYTGKSNSIVDALNSMKIDFSLAHRKAIAKANGISITDNVGMNTKLLAKLKQGTLIKA